MTAAPNSTEIAERTPQQELVSQIRSDEFTAQVALALPETVTPQRFVRATVTALLENPDIAAPDVNRDSIFRALLRCAQDGLLPDGREAAISVYKDNKNGGRTAQYLSMFEGLRKTVGEFGWQVSAEVVHANDVFEYEKGLNTKLRHVPARPGTDRGPMIAAYAIAKHISGEKAEPVVMWAADIAKRKAKAKTDKFWNDWPERMWQKTVGRAIVKELPKVSLDPRIQRILAAEEMDPAEAQRALYGGNGTPALPPADAPASSAGDGPQAAGGGSDSGALLAKGMATAPAPGDVQQAEASALPSVPAEASAPDSAPLPGEPVGEPEPEQASMFQPPAGAVSNDLDALMAAARAAGQEIITIGGHKGSTIEAVGSSGGRGESWIAWAIKTPEFAHHSAAKTYARVYLPETYTKAIAELEAGAQS